MNTTMALRRVSTPTAPMVNRIERTMNGAHAVHHFPPSGWFFVCGSWSSASGRTRPSGAALDVARRRDGVPRADSTRDSGPRRRCRRAAAPACRPRCAAQTPGGGSGRGSRSRRTSEPARRRAGPGTAPASAAPVREHHRAQAAVISSAEVTSRQTLANMMLASASMLPGLLASSRPVTVPASSGRLRRPGSPRISPPGIAMIAVPGSSRPPSRRRRRRQHQHEEEQHQDRAGVDDDLHHEQERRVERGIERRSSRRPAAGRTALRRGSRARP